MKENKYREIIVTKGDKRVLEDKILTDWFVLKQNETA